MTLGSLLGTMPDQGRLLGWRPATPLADGHQLLG
jgi:hypothetical protein